jgi:glutamate synthase domain-containing protein 1
MFLKFAVATSPEVNAGAKKLLGHIVAMLTSLGQRGYTVGDQLADYGVGRIDTDTDSDPDADKP